MTTLTEGQHAGEFIVSEAARTRSRETITVASGQDLVADAVLGRIASGGSATAAAFAGNTGDGAMGTITVGTAAVNGVYTLTIVEAAPNAGAFIVDDPDGVPVGHGGTVGVAFSAGGLAFTLADGATDFAVGDGFDITVSGVTDEYKEYDPTNTDGSETAVGILYAAVDASAADADGVAIVRDAEVSELEIVWFTSATTTQKATGVAELKRAGIIAR